MLVEDVSRLLKKNGNGKKWVAEAVPVLIEVMEQIKDIETRKDEEVEPYKVQIKEIEEKYKPFLLPLNEMNGQIREKIVQCVDEPTTIQGDNGGRVVFVESLETEIFDVDKLDPKYVMKVPDMKAIKEAMKRGVTNIKGVKVVPKYSVRVYTK